MLILKFGGAAVASPENFAKIADLIVAQEAEQVVVVVSAMANMTDELLALARQVHPTPPKREVDMLISTGERISMSLLAMALHLKGKEAVSLTGSQAGIITTSDHTDAKIVDVRPYRLLNHLSQGKIVIVAGFQGVSRDGEITTLGRGGSDTTAAALAIALRTKKPVRFYKDVDGIFAEDPKKNHQAKFFPHLDYPEALDLMQGGAKILHLRCVKLAAKNGIALHVLPFKSEGSGTLIGEMKEFIPGVFEDD